MTLSFPHSYTTHTQTHTHGTHFSALFLFPFFFFQFLKMLLRRAAAQSRRGRDSSQQPADRKSLRSHGRRKPGCIWRVLILSYFFFIIIIIKGNWFYFIVEDYPKRMFFNKSVVLFWLLKTKNLMAVVTVFATSPSRQDRCGFVFPCSLFSFFLFKPSPPLALFFPSSVLGITHFEVGKLKKN